MSNTTGILSRDQIRTVVDRGAQSLLDYCRLHNIHYLVTGQSGGLDSAVTLGFAQRACQLAEANNFQLTSVGLIMPCHSDESAERLGMKAIEKFGAKQMIIDLTPTFDHAFNNSSLMSHTDIQVRQILKETGGDKSLTEWTWSQKIAQGNIKARLRMMYGTYHVARMMQGMVLSTDNLSEFWMAFWTINGDVGDYGIVQQIMKGLELYQIAEYLGVPDEILEAKPDDGLNVGNGDADQLGADYPTIDRIMVHLIQQGFDPDGSMDQLDGLPAIDGVHYHIVRSIAERCLRGAFKRHGTIILSRENLDLPPIKEIVLP
ncbi:MAG: NAD(+) synthase [Chloroflexi bacterium]|jgi:NAD+ synthase|nr:NAD(+) synthase [Candidatus Parcubacteria bacterium]MBT7082134.1 NAD(+) synthase [Chloroflexota bacterium]